MTNYNLLQENDPRIHEKSADVINLDDKVRANILTLLNALDGTSLVGIAAPQLGLPGRYIIVYDFEISEDGQRKRNGLPLILVNPTIDSLSEETVDGYEGCGSVCFGEKFGIVPRSKKLKVSYLDFDGNSSTIEAEDFLARVLQHEIDHLDGILFTDRMRPEAKLIDKNEYLNSSQLPSPNQE